MRRAMRGLALAAALALLTQASPGMSQVDMPDEAKSTRKVLTCNTDGTYTCKNENCNGQYCCEIP